MLVIVCVSLRKHYNKDIIYKGDLNIIKRGKNIRFGHELQFKFIFSNLIENTTRQGTKGNKKSGSE